MGKASQQLKPVQNQEIWRAFDSWLLSRLIFSSEACVNNTPVEGFGRISHCYGFIPEGEHFSHFRYNGLGTTGGVRAKGAYNSRFECRCLLGEGRNEEKEWPGGALPGRQGAPPRVWRGECFKGRIEWAEPFCFLGRALSLESGRLISPPRSAGTGNCDQPRGWAWVPHRDLGEAPNFLSCV